MLFNSFQFLIFFPIVLIVYYVIPKKVKYIWLLVSSYYFYMCWNAKYALLILASTVVTYISGLLIEKIKVSIQNPEGSEQIRILFDFFNHSYCKKYPKVR